MSSDGSGDNNSLKDEINKLIADNKVMVFSATYCPYCTKAKKILGKYQLNGYKVLEIDNTDNADSYLKILGDMTGAHTVPRVFINGTCIGGGDDTEQLDKKGQLEPKLKEVGALANES